MESHGGSLGNTVAFVMPAHSCVCEGVCMCSENCVSGESRSFTVSECVPCKEQAYCPGCLCLMLSGIDSRLNSLDLDKRQWRMEAIITAKVCLLMDYILHCFSIAAAVSQFTCQPSEKIDRYNN